MSIISINVTIILLLYAPFSIVYCTPVYFWNIEVGAKPVFPQIKKEEFIAEIKPHGDTKMIVAFTYKKLTLRKLQCEDCFPYLNNQTPASLYANVEKPVMALKSYKSAKELSIDEYGELPTQLIYEAGTLYIISLNNLNGSLSPMNSCDDVIKEITSSLNSSDVAYMFTGAYYETGELSGQLCRSQGFAFYLGQLEFHNSSGVQVHKIVKITAKSDGDMLTATLTTNVENTAFEFIVHLYNRYFEIKHITLNNQTFRIIDLYAPLDSSYSCGKIVLRRDGKMFVFKRVQIQYDYHLPLHFKFHDAWTCEGFTTPAIISGIFVTAILVGIVTLGISMLMNVQTPTKFDTTDGHTIFINAYE